MAPQYPRDRFDDIPHDRDRVGAHRIPRRAHRGWITFAWAALATGVLVGLGVIGLMVINGNVAFDGRLPGSGAESSATSDATDSAAPEATPETTPAIEPTIDPSLAVAVLNGTPTAGLATRVGDTLAADGWTIDQISNADTEGEAVTTIFYSDPANEAAARGLAQSLGVTTVTLSEDYIDTGAALIAVVGIDYVEPASE